jgi:hypothetical protein
MKRGINQYISIGDRFEKIEKEILKLKQLKQGHLKQGHCGECKWCVEHSYERKIILNYFGLCTHNMASYIVAQGTKENFGCVYHEPKGK